MSTHGCSKQYSRRSKKQTRSNSDDESAARTRPFSFEDIMLRRKTKGSAATVEVDATSTDNRASERIFRHSKGSSLDVQNLSLEEESAKDSSRRKKEETVLKNNMVVRSDRNNYESGLSLMSKLKHDRNENDERQKYGQESLGWGKNDQSCRIDIETETAKRHSRDTACKDRRQDHSRGESEKESKRKPQNGEDDRNRDSKRKSQNGDDDRNRDSKRKSQNVDDEINKDGKRKSQNGDDDKNRVSKRKSQNGDDDRNRDSKRKSQNGDDERNRDSKRKSQNGDDERNRAEAVRENLKMVMMKGTETVKENLKMVMMKGTETVKENLKMVMMKGTETVKENLKMVMMTGIETNSRLKRRQKRSPDRESKHRRSVSLSPRSHKHSTKLARQKELPLESHVKKSGRWRSDSERTGDFTNTSNSQYRRHSGSTSGLGGYSPRKRRTESAVKTPSPLRTPEEKNEVLDLPPTEKVGLFSGSVASNFPPSNPTVSLGISNDQSGGAFFSSAMGKSLSVVSSNNIAMKTKVSLDLVQLTQATRPMRRLYIENLPHSASEKAIIDCLNGFLMSSGVNHIEGTQPCISCIIHKDRGQALVEFLTPEDASAALLFDGSDFSGSTLKIRRPKDYIETVTGDLDKSMPVVNKISDVVEDSPNKIIVAGISNRLSSEMLRDVVTAFGRLKAYHFEINDDLNGPCAFLEYVDESVVSKACAGLNGMKIGGQVLKVFPAVPFPLTERTGCQPCYGIPEHVKPLLQRPSVVLKINNVFNADVLPVLSESDIDEVLEDIRFECARFGTVKSVNFVKPCISAEEEYKQISDITDVDIKHEIQENSTTVISRNSNDLEDNNANLDNCPSDSNQKQANCPDNGRHQDEAVEDKLCQMGNTDATCFEVADCENASERTGHVLSEQRSSPENDFQDAKVTEIIETGLDKKLVCVEASSSMMADNEKKSLNGLDPVVRIASNAVEKSEKKDPDNNQESLFVLGSVFVEFGRIEASCMAAHSLHGRIYDGQEISIEYIPHGLYRKRFPK
uniref:RRM domain-containing protein n=1 Tax=Cucumis sativus TaxID=3659 RepID=A0A0A0LLH4_CUCSA